MKKWREEMKYMQRSRIQFEKFLRIRGFNNLREAVILSQIYNEKIRRANIFNLQRLKYNLMQFLKEYKIARITYLGYKHQKLMIANNHYKMILFEHFRE